MGIDERAAVWAQEKLATADMEGSMVGLWVPEEVGKKIKQRGGEPVDNLHITLCYFQDKAADKDDWDEVKELARGLTRPLTGKIGGWGVFLSEGLILWATIDVPGLQELQVDLARVCTNAGFAINTEHGWVPHITLAYDWAPTRDEFPFYKTFDVEFPGLTFAQGEEKEHLWT